VNWRPAITHNYAIMGTLFAVPIAILALWQSRELASERAEEWDRQLVARSHDVADDVAQVLVLRMEQIRQLADRAGALADWSADGRLRGIFDEQTSVDGFFRVYLNDPWGTVQVSSPARDSLGEAQAGINYGDRPYMRKLQATLQPVISDGLLGRRTHKPSISMIAPILRRDGTLRGSVTGAMQLDEVRRRIDNNARAGQVHVVLVDSAGAVLADSKHQLQVLGRYPLPPQLGLGGLDGVETLDDRFDDPAFVPRQVRRASAPLLFTGQGWRVYVSMPSAQIAARIEEIGGHTQWATIAAWLASMAIVYLMARSARRDVAHLREMQRQVVQGNFQLGAEQPSRMMPREVHNLWTGMKDMATQVGEQHRARTQLISELQRANEHSRSLAAGLRDTHDGFVVLDRERRIVYVNPAWLRMRGLEREEAIGRKALELDPETGISPAQIQAIEEAISARHGWSGSVTFRHHEDGSSREIDLSISPVFNDQCEIEHYVQLARDVTARREAEAALQQSERLASLGMLAAGVAHEINNPMTYVLGNLEHLHELAGDGSLTVDPGAEVDLKLCLDDCIHGARRVVEIVADLRALSQQRQDTHSAVASALQTMETCLRMAQSQIRHCAEVVRKLPTEDLWFSINPQRLSQVLLNLILNAVQAMSVANAATNKLTVTVRRRPDGRGEISVSDTGSGMSLEVAQRIFDPFFTTKGTGVGTGLGLSICHSIIAAARGEILVESELGKGTCFRIVLPLAALAEETAATQMASLRGLSVLVVDDEPGVLTAIRRMLASCRTSTATSVKQALEMIEHDHYDLVLSDVMMAETSGVELVQELRRCAPALAKKVCLMSGGVIGGALAQEVRSIGVPLLHKPMTRGELHEALWQVHNAVA
jgi:PAS domain S-box-containing protein